ncbi:restriction system protein [Mycolicibacterium mucogenicum 261Sha1.1M5]|nr:restriction system protein [Mycolicibacterium mucogenicum 261Sha1.1M5]
MTDAWVVRTGKHGERDAWALARGYAGGGWREVPDLSACETREQVAAVVEQSFPGAATGMITNYTAQLWALRGRIRPGDLIALPLKTTREIALGRVTGGYAYLADEEDVTRRHVVKVDWQITDLPRSTVKQDLLYTLGSALTIFSPSRGHAVERLTELLKSRTDPGQLPFEPHPVLPTSSDAAVDEPETQPEIEEAARDQIRNKISETFKGHDLTVLITRILEAEGFVCDSSTGGADGGVDIVAGHGLLGMESPRLIAQVKSGGQVSDQVVRDLLGAMQHVGNADQGLLVAWDGVSSNAKQSLQRERFRLRLWTAEDVVDAVLKVYPKLPEEIQAELPLRRVWMLA